MSASKLSGVFPGKHQDIHPPPPLLVHPVLKHKGADSLDYHCIPEGEPELPLEIPGQGGHPGPHEFIGGGEMGSAVGLGLNRVVRGDHL